MPDGIGPHEGRELELMLVGKKPMAMFSDVVPASMYLPVDEFSPYVQSGRFVQFEETYHPQSADRLPMRFVYFALRGEVWRIEEMCKINDSLFAQGQRTTDEIEKKIGHLLGYSEEQVADFIVWQQYLNSHDNLT